MVFPSTPGVSVRVLRTIFVPGCGGPHEFVNSVSFSHFLSAVIPFSVSHLLSRSLIRSLASSFPGTLPTFPDFLFVPLSSLFTLPFLFLLMSSSFDPFLLVLPLPARSSLPPPRSPTCLEGPMGALWFVCWKAYQHHRRHHWNLSLVLSLLPLPRSLLFSLFPLLSPFFPPLFLMWKFWAIAGCFCGLVGMAFLEECLMLWL